MPGSQDHQNEFDEDTKAKLRQIRSDSTRAKNILNELEAYYQSFDAIRKQLDDGNDGLEANLTWSTQQKTEIDAIVTSANTKVTELETIAASINTQVAEVQAQYDSFTPLAAKVTDPTTGIQAMVTTATTLKDSVAELLVAAKTDSESTATALADIQEKSDEVETAYDAFLVLKKQVDDPETGMAAQLAEIKQYAADALTAKTSAESGLLSITSMEETATTHLETVKITKIEIDGLKTESENLTNDIRNTLDMTSAHSLSTEIQAQRKKLDKAVLLWGIAVTIAILAFATALGLIFYTLFLDKNSKGLITSINGTSVFLTVLSKALFTSPFIFALYFTTTNFSRTREYRDRYVAKEISAKNLQAYVKLLRDEFPENSDERLAFALHNMQAIYNDPTPSKKRSYNLGINKIFQFGVQEEDVQLLQEKLVQGAEDIIENKKSLTPSK